MTADAVGREQAPGYYGQPVLKAPIWKWPVPTYFFTGGLAAGTTLLGAGARILGDHATARRCQFAAMGATVASTALLIEDLGRPARFLNMLRVAKVTSPMSVGTWVLTAFGAATGAATLSELTGVGPRAARATEAVATLLAPVLATYTAVLVADTAVPAWHEARRELPVLFAGSALAGSGALALLYAPAGRGRSAARRMALLGATTELAASNVMKRRLGDLGRPYHRPGGAASQLSCIATAATTAGGFLVGATDRQRRRSRAAVKSTSDPSRSPVTSAGALLLLGGALAERFAVFHAGIESARDPVATIEPQRRRLDHPPPSPPVE